MNSPVVSASGLSKRFGTVQALRDVSFKVEAGQIVGLIGPNGAGKTTALKALLGLTSCAGELTVLGLDPFRSRPRLMQEVSFIADIAVLPRWMKVRQVLEFAAAVHPRFDPARAVGFLGRTDIRLDARVQTLSKGMVAQLHLALVMAIDARLLVLDEPTLGLDILYRKSFYESLLNDYFDEKRTIIITTHQVEEVEHILTDLMFIQHGRIVLHASMDDVAERYAEVMVSPARHAEALALKPIYERKVFGKHVLLFENADRARLAKLGEINTPSVADLFVGKMQEATP